MAIDGTQLGSSFSMSSDTFRKRMKEEVEQICRDRGLDFQTHKQKGSAFQLWTADLLMRAHRGVETDVDDAVFESRDIQIDVALEDNVSEKLILAQCKCGSFQSHPSPIDEVPVSSFFSRHELLMDREWLRKHASQKLFHVLSDYNDRFKNGWSVDYYFVTTESATDKTKKIVEQRNLDYAERNLSIKCVLLGREELRDFYLRTVSLEGGVGITLNDLIPSDSHFFNAQPYPTLVAAVKANWIRNIYSRGGARERVFALNIRDWLGRRTGINKTMVDTITNDASNFFYYNNGISAICTGLTRESEGHNVRIRAENFQIINGAQTVGAIVDATPKGDDAWVLLRITQPSSSKSEQKTINDNIIRYNNTQNLVKVSDFCANDQIQLWLEGELAKHKAREHLPIITYQRRRGASTRAKKGALLLKLEDLGKIRYAFKYDPSVVINSPKDLFLSRSQHSDGAYEKAFGIADKLEVLWPATEFNECLVAIAFFLAIEKGIKGKRINDETLTFLNQLKFFFVSLAGVYFRKEYDASQTRELATTEKAFSKAFETFWKKAMFIVQSGWKRNENSDSPMPLRTFARSRQVWDTISQEFTLLMEHQVI